MKKIQYGKNKEFLANSYDERVLLHNSLTKEEYEALLEGIANDELVNKANKIIDDDFNGRYPNKTWKDVFQEHFENHKEEVEIRNEQDRSKEILDQLEKDINQSAKSNPFLARRLFN